MSGLLAPLTGPISDITRMGDEPEEENTSVLYQKTTETRYAEGKRDSPLVLPGALPLYVLPSMSIDPR